MCVWVCVCVGGFVGVCVCVCVCVCVLFILLFFLINPSSPKGVATTPLRVFALVLKIAQPGVKLLQVPSSSSFPFILAKKFRTYHLHRG